MSASPCSRHSKSRVCSSLNLVLDNPGPRLRLSRVILQACFPRLRKVETIKVHHLVPGRYKVMDKLLLRVRTSVDFGQGSELGI